MNRLSRITLLSIVLALVFGLGLSAAPAFASADNSTFNLTVAHRINGLDLGLERSLPVDVYVNGGLAFTFRYADTIQTQLPAGTYEIEVKLAGTNTTVMSLGPVDIPAGVDVSIRAVLVNQTPTLRVGIR